VNYAGLIKWLEGIDSHVVYAASMLDEMQEFGIVVIPMDKFETRIGCEHNGDHVATNVYTAPASEVEQQMRESVGGGTIDTDAVEEDMTLVMGLNISAALCRLFDVQPDHVFYGRNKQHRSNVAALAMALDPHSRKVVRS
jgi:hypothetical protein